MVDDFMVCVDRIIASACFQAVNGGREGVRDGGGEESKKIDGKSDCVVVSVTKGGDGGEGCSSKKFAEMVECRICQEEDHVLSMEAPCACNGSLKFAHRKCIQRWCNKKGDTTCEICEQVFSPNYSAPQTKGSPDVLAIDMRSTAEAVPIIYRKEQAWTIYEWIDCVQAWSHHYGLGNSQLLVLAASEHQFFESEYEDYVVANAGSMACFRMVTLVLLVILLIRQVLVVTRYVGMLQESSAFFFNFQVSLLQLAGFLLPCYVIARTWYQQYRRRRQG